MHHEQSCHHYPEVKNKLQFKHEVSLRTSLLNRARARHKVALRASMSEMVTVGLRLPTYLNSRTHAHLPTLNVDHTIPARIQLYCYCASRNRNRPDQRWKSEKEGLSGKMIAITA